MTSQDFKMVDSEEEFDWGMLVCFIRLKYINKINMLYIYIYECVIINVYVHMKFYICVCVCVLRIDLYIYIYIYIYMSVFNSVIRYYYIRC